MVAGLSATGRRASSKPSFAAFSRLRHDPLASVPSGGRMSMRLCRRHHCDGCGCLRGTKPRCRSSCRDYAGDQAASPTSVSGREIVDAAMLAHRHVDPTEHRHQPLNAFRVACLLCRSDMSPRALVVLEHEVHIGLQQLCRVHQQENRLGSRSKSFWMVMHALALPNTQLTHSHL